jgi:hypothetical protein
MDSKANRVILAIQAGEAQKVYLAQLELVRRLKESGCSEALIDLEAQEAERLQGVWEQLSEQLAAIS